VKGDNGIFDVAVNGELVFSKNRDGRFPADAEVVARLKQLAANR
jgi:selT/selW/selH-like putative selenoprotein